MSKLYVRIFGNLLFWGWNVLAVFLFVFLIGLTILPFVLIATFNGEIPLSISVCFLILMFIPLYAIYFGARNPKKVMPFFFGVEIPIIILILFRLFIVRELTLGSAFLLLSGLMGISVFGWAVIKSSKDEGRMSPYVIAIGQTFVLLVGIFVAVLSALYALPFFAGFIKGLLSLKWLSDFKYIDAFLVIFAGLFVTGSMAFFVFPVFISYFYPKSWLQKSKALAPDFSKRRYGFVSLATVAVWLLAFTSASHQGQAGYVASLEKMSASEQAAEMQKPENVRQALLNAYLYEYRYLGVKGQDRNLVPLYKRSLGNKSLGEKAQALQSYLLGPLIYKGEIEDNIAAGKLYAKLFDTSIQREERKAITKALEATYNRDEVTAGLMNIGARNVIIREQNIDITQASNTTRVEIEEVYENLTFANQEIFYYFTLPEDVAITGIWIGLTDKREQMDAYIVAPRGAAQKVYEAQVRRNIDPALLEQVGPGQYRLRVFPIPVTKGRAQFDRRRRQAPGDEAEKFMRVHMRYVLPAAHKGEVLPQLLEKRNVDWSRKTKRTLNGAPLKFKKGWMPIYDLSGDEIARPFSVQMGDQLISMNSQTSPAASPLGKFAVIVDTSYSMSHHRREISDVLDKLAALKNGEDTSLDFFVARANDTPMTQVERFSEDELSPFGSLTLQQILTGFVQIPKADDYDAVIILTDQGLYGQSEAPVKAALQSPLYILHVDKLAPAYDDDVLDLIYRSGGGVARTVSDIQQQIAYNSEASRISAERVWTLGSVSDVAQTENSAEEKALAARQLILMQSFGAPPSNEALDGLHALATEHDVISPYSSMIVLVNERQKEALKKASEADDRFDRESRSGEENLSAPPSPLVSGVPEPHEWLLIIIAVIGLFWLWRRRDDWENSGRFLT